MTEQLYTVTAYADDGSPMQLHKHVSRADKDRLLDRLGAMPKVMSAVAMPEDEPAQRGNGRYR